MSDYISREAAIEELRKAADCANCDVGAGGLCGFCDIDNAARLINGIPAADVEPVRHVHCKVWGIDEYYGEWLRCPSCGYGDNVVDATYCGGCGAKIDLEDKYCDPVESDFCSYGKAPINSLPLNQEERWLKTV